MGGRRGGESERERQRERERERERCVTPNTNNVLSISGVCHAGNYVTDDINADYLTALEESTRVKLRNAGQGSKQLAAGAA